MTPPLGAPTNVPAARESAGSIVPATTRGGDDATGKEPSTGVSVRRALGTAPGRRRGHFTGSRFAASGRAFAVVTTAALFSVAVVRVAVQLRWGQPTGLDTGNFLSFGHTWLGHHLPGGAGSTYPPIVPVLLVVLTSTFGPLIAMVAVTTLATLVYGGSIAAVLWRAGARWWALPLSMALTASTGVGEAVAWGGTPQLLAHGVAFAALFVLARMLLAPTVRTGLLLGLAFLLVGATSHLVFAEAVAAAIAMVVLRPLAGLPRPSRAGIRRLVLSCLATGLPVLVLLPLYVRLAATVGGSFAQRQDTHTVAMLLHHVAHSVRELPHIWTAALVFAALVPAALWRRRTEPLWLVNAGLTASGLAVLALSPEPRFAYLAPLLTAAGLGLVAGERLTHRHWLRMAGVVVVVAVLLVSSVRALTIFPAQVRYYGEMIPAGTTEALEVLRHSTPADALVAVPPIDGVPFGWWVEGYARRAALIGSSSQWLNFPAERRRSVDAVRLFSSADVFSERWFGAAHDLGVDVVYLPANWDAWHQIPLRQLRHQRPDLIIRANSAAVIVEVP